MRKVRYSPPIETWFKSLKLALLVPFFTNLSLAGIFYLFGDIMWFLFVLFSTVGLLVHLGAYLLVGPLLLKLFWECRKDFLWSGANPYLIGACIGGAVMSLMGFIFPQPLQFCLGGAYGAVTAHAVLKARRKVLMR